MKYFLLTIKFLIPLTAFAFLAYQSQGYIIDLHGKASFIKPPLLIASIFLLLPVFIMNAFGWHLIVRVFNHDISFSRSLNIWFYSSFTRYIPGVIWPYTTRIKLCTNLGINKYDTTSSMLLENCFLASCSLCVSLPIIGVHLNSTITLIFIVLGFSVLLYTKRILSLLSTFKINNEHIRNIIASFLKLESAHFINIWAFYCLLWLFFSIAFGLFCTSISNFETYEFLTLIQVAMCFPISFAVGFIATITPGGIGIREGTLFSLLILFIDPQDAAVISIASRLWLIFTEVIVGTMLYLANVLRK
ncbi:lysylphosphatidylglycerol synthase domain-containing protein [Ketobacter nezhaii]|uniref:lysylphosphatidylglycerol synthase domain-containing protein n=1 Tax=Ketobacter sp. MCCC 1A13808 TaxID=2602738 RepID=UPI0018DD272E|nr:lysylphosphatidylglycerol synthase domain-containing protein [Ketobacter sp. MCCC 1A13808]